MKRSKLMLEDYVTFFHNPDVEKYTMNQLQEILSINGFCQPKTKGKLMEDLFKLELTSPRRSTVRNHAAAFPSAALTVDEVKDDVRLIGWEGCPIGSVLAVGSAVEEEKEESTNLSRPISGTTASSGVGDVSPIELRKTKKRGRKKKTKALIPV